MKIRAVLALIGLCLATGLPAASAAQYTSSFGFTFNNPVSATCNTMLWNRMNARLLYRSMLKKRGYTDAQLDQMTADQMKAILLGGKADVPKSATKPVQAVKQPANPATRFKPTPKMLLMPALAESLNKDKAQQKALLELFAGGLRAYDVEAKKIGLLNDVAGSITFFIGCAYMVVHEGDEPDGDGLELVARALQVNLDTKGFRSVPDADKQKFHELMVGMGTFLMASYKTASEDKDAELMALTTKMARDVLKGFLKIDPAKLKITRNGIEMEG